MKNGKQAKKTATYHSAIAIFQFMHSFSPDGNFYDHSTTYDRGLLLKAGSRQAFLNAEMGRSNESLAPLQPESARSLRETVYRWMRESLVGPSRYAAIELRCDGEKENRDEDRYSPERKQYKRLSQAERASIETALNACREEGEPEIKLIPKVKRRELRLIS